MQKTHRRHSVLTPKPKDKPMLVIIIVNCINCQGKQKLSFTLLLNKMNKILTALMLDDYEAAFPRQ